MPKHDPTPAERERARRWKQCRVLLCPHPVNGLSLYCGIHHHNAVRNGSPTQTFVRRYETAPFRKIVGRMLRANSDHPALSLIFTELDSLLADAVGRANRNPCPGPQDTSGRQAVHLARLHEAGITGRDVFAACAAMHFFARAHPDRLEPFSRAYRIALARSLKTKHTPGPHKRPTGRVCDHLGQYLAVQLAGILKALEPVYDSFAASLPSTVIRKGKP